MASPFDLPGMDPATWANIRASMGIGTPGVQAPIPTQYGESGELLARGTPGVGPSGELIRPAFGGIPPNYGAGGGAAAAGPAAESVGPTIAKTMSPIARKMAGRLGLPLLLAQQGVTGYRDVTTPGMTGLDIAGRVAEGAGRVGGAFVGGEGGAMLGALGGPAAPLTVPAGALIGGGLGYFAPDIANKIYNMVTGGSNELASTHAANLRAAQAPAAAPVTPPAAPAAAGSGTDLVPPGTTPIGVTPGPNGAPMIGGVGEQGDVPGQVGYAGPGAMTFAGAGAPGAGAVPLLHQGPAYGGSYGGVIPDPHHLGINLSPETSAALSAARQAAAARGDWDAVAASYGGDFAGHTPPNPTDALREKLVKLPLNTAGDVERYKAVAGALAASEGNQATTARTTAQYNFEADKAESDRKAKAEEIRIAQQNANTNKEKAAKDRIVLGAPDIAGKQKIIDLNTGKETNPTAPPPTYDEFVAQAKLNPAYDKLTPAELKAEYQRQIVGK